MLRALWNLIMLMHRIQDPFLLQTASVLIEGLSVLNIGCIIRTLSAWGFFGI